MLNQFKELYEKQDVLAKLTSREFLHGYGYSDIHCIDLIGKLEEPNVTKLSAALSMTRGAVSKIVKKLLLGGEITSYRAPGNKKEVYYTLTEKGRTLYLEHAKRHGAWEARDAEFFAHMDRDTKECVGKFLTEFNLYLEKKIETFH